MSDIIICLIKDRMEKLKTKLYYSFILSCCKLHEFTLRELFLKALKKSGQELNPKLFLIRRPFQDYIKITIPVVKTTGYTAFPFQGNNEILILLLFLKKAIIRLY
ncbi:MAG: hypothetical protein ACQEQS_09905 [Thermodesulfobacteriota bacterium]